MRNYVSEGRQLTLAAPYAVDSGQGVLVGQIFGVAMGDAENGADVDILTHGVVDLAADLTDTWTVGAPVYWSDSRKLCIANTADDSSNSTDSNSGGDADALIGVAVASKGAGASVVRVKLGQPVTLV